jgi:hypothetical protein
MGWAVACDPSSQLRVGNGSGQTATSETESEAGTDEPVWINGASLVGLPDARSIHMAGDTGANSSTPIYERCKGLHPKSPIGFPIFFSCMVAQMGDYILYGDDADSDKDGKLTCHDYKQGDAPEVVGVITGLLCDKKAFSTPPIRTMRFETEKNEIGISFDGQLSDQVPGIGRWSSIGGDEQRYPADIKIWRRPTNASDLKGILAMDLDSPYRGTMWFDDLKGTISARGRIIYSSEGKSAQCVGSPSVDGCYWQDITLSKLAIGSAGSLTKSLEGTHIRVLANDRFSPTIVIVEGRLRAGSSGFDSSLTGPSSALSSAVYSQTVEIYYRFVKKDGSLWASFEYLDKDGALLQVPYDIAGQSLNLGKVARDGLEGSTEYAGNCINLDSGAFVACKGLNHTDYSELWLGKENFPASVGELVFPFEFGPPPGVIGIDTVPP